MDLLSTTLYTAADLQPHESRASAAELRELGDLARTLEAEPAKQLEWAERALLESTSYATAAGSAYLRGYRDALKGILQGKVVRDG